MAEEEEGLTIYSPIASSTVRARIHARRASPGGLDPQAAVVGECIRGPRGNRRVQDREALTRREIWGVLRDYSPMASSTVRARIHARCASHVVSATAPDARRLAR